MSLYYDAASILSSEKESGSLRSRIYNEGPRLRSKPAQVYALISEVSKYDAFLKEVIDHADILSYERKLTPLLSLLLVHDLIFSKNGIAAPAGHPLRQIVEKHKRRLQAEVTKARLRRRCTSLEDLKVYLSREKQQQLAPSQSRWVRINTLMTTLEEQLHSTFLAYDKCEEFGRVLEARPHDKLFCLDPNIPNLLALPPEHDLSQTPAYKSGQIILQDKASCFPAYLLLGNDSGDSWQCGDILDACAAPGNKTSHLAAICARRKTATKKLVRRIFACERDPTRSLTLSMMLEKVGAGEVVSLLANQDFLNLDPEDEKFRKVTHILLDPSCSGSGIITREDVPTLALPDPSKKTQNAAASESSRKRKRTAEPPTVPAKVSNSHIESSTIETEEESKDHDTGRLLRLSNFQTHLLCHALSFPAARRIAYSTCSTHQIEDESVAARALSSHIAKLRGWRLLRREEQAEGLRVWPHRGQLDKHSNSASAKEQQTEWPTLTEKELQACIRCHPGTEDGTIGFFVCAFVRESNSDTDQAVLDQTSTSKPEAVVSEAEWEGFSDE